MNLNEVLTLMAAQLKADPQELISYAAEDTLGGYHIDEAQRRFPQGSLWGVEGQILYTLVRWLKPQVIAEIGGWAGASASHLALAVRENGAGHVFSVDSGVGGQEPGRLVPGDLKPYVTHVRADGRDWLAEQDDGSIGLLFEDADHSTALTAALSRLALKKCMPGGLLLNHDAAHDFAILGDGNRIGSTVGREVRDGLALANAYFKPYLADPSDCGLALTVIPGVRPSASQLLKTPVDIYAEADDSPLADYGIAPIESAPVQKKSRRKK